MTMLVATGTPLPIEATMPKEASRSGHQHRVLLVGVGCFSVLRLLQERAPGPRLDMRYLVEGAAVVIRADHGLHGRWMAASRQALIDHLAATPGTQSPQAHRTGRPMAAEGAQARTPGSPATGAHHDDCKALQIGETAFQWLKAVQRTTRDPRLDMRYLVEGAISLLRQAPHLLPSVIGHARRSLCEHLQQLDPQSIEPFTLEKHP